MTESIPELRFPVRKIKEEGGLAAQVTIPTTRAKELVCVQTGALEGPVSIQVEFSVGGNRILLQARLQGAWRLACSRCLAEHAAPFSSELDETYDLSEEAIDLTEDVRQALLLEIPQRTLCRPDCRGLCPRCGKNLNEGPCGCPAKPPSAFDALKKLKGR